MSTALQIKNVSHKFGEFKALNNVSMKIDSGDFTVLLGLNGAGKTTLYSLITRLYNNNSGSIKIHNFDVREESSDALKNIGVVFQQPTLDLDLSVEENLHYHSSLHGLSFADAKESRALGHTERALTLALSAVRQYPSFACKYTIQSDCFCFSGTNYTLIIFYIE